MTDIVIKAENLGKKYTIGHQAEKGRGVTFREVLMQNARSLWFRARKRIKSLFAARYDRQDGQLRTRHYVFCPADNGGSKLSALTGTR